VRTSALTVAPVAAAMSAMLAHSAMIVFLV